MNATITYYKVDSCGYFPRGSAKPSFGTFDRLFIDITDWHLKNDLTVEETATFPADPDRGQLPVYCVGSHREQGTDGIIVTWNETETADADSFGSLSRSSAVNTPKFSRSPIPKNSIPGYPSYFWMIPDRNAVVSVKFDHQRLTGHQGLKHYCQHFLDTYSPHVAYVEGDDGVTEIAGYRIDDGSKITRYFPRFRISRMRRKTDVDMIRRRRPQIVKIARRKMLSYGDAVEGSMIQTTLRLIGLPRNRSVGTDLRFQSELELRPTEAELEAILNHYESEAPDGWDDVGFRFAGESGILWLSQTAPTVQVDLDLQRRSDGLVMAESLYSALSKRRSRILQQIADE